MVEVNGGRVQFNDGLIKDLAKINHSKHEDWKGLQTSTVASKVFGYNKDFQVKVNKDGQEELKTVKVNLKSLMNIYGVKHKHLGDFQKIVEDVRKEIKSGSDTGDKKVELETFLDRLNTVLLAAYDNENVKKGEDVPFNPSRFKRVFKHDAKNETTFNLIREKLTPKVESSFSESFSLDSISGSETSGSHEINEEESSEIDVGAFYEQIESDQEKFENTFKDLKDYAGKQGIEVDTVGQDAKIVQDYNVKNIKLDTNVFLIKDPSGNENFNSLIVQNIDGTFSAYGTKTDGSKGHLTYQKFDEVDQALAVCQQVTNKTQLGRNISLFYNESNRLEGFSFFAPKRFEIAADDFSRGQFIVMPDNSNKDYPYGIHYRSSDGRMKSLNFKFKNPGVQDNSILIHHRGRDWPCNDLTNLSSAIAFMDNLNSYSEVSGSWNNIEIIPVSRDGESGSMRLVFGKDKSGHMTIKYNPKAAKMGESGNLEYDELTFTVPSADITDREEAIKLLAEYIKGTYGETDLKMDLDAVAVAYPTVNFIREGSTIVTSSASNKWVKLSEEGLVKCGNLVFDSIEDFVVSEDVLEGSLLANYPCNFKGKAVSVPIKDQLAALVTGPIKDIGVNEYSIEKVGDEGLNKYKLSWKMEDRNGNIVDRNIEMQAFDDHEYIELTSGAGTKHIINDLFDIPYAIRFFSSTFADKPGSNSSTCFYLKDGHGVTCAGYISPKGNLNVKARVEKEDGKYTYEYKKIEGSFESFSDVEALIERGDLENYKILYRPEHAISSTFIKTRDVKVNDEFQTYSVSYNSTLDNSEFSNLSDLKISTEKVGLKYILRDMSPKKGIPEEPASVSRDSDIEEEESSSSFVSMKESFSEKESLEDREVSKENLKSETSVDNPLDQLSGKETLKDPHKERPRAPGNRRLPRRRGGDS